MFTLVVTDNDGAFSVADTVTISVNAPPVANAGVDQSLNLALGGSTVDVTLDGGGSTDSDGTIATYTWTGTPDPADVVSPVVTLGAGTHVFTLVVTDDDGAASAADTVTISVNTPPVADAGPDQGLSLALGASTVNVTLDGSGSADSDGTVASYAWTGTPDPADTANPVVSFGAGDHVFTLIVTDDDGAASAADTVTISVNAPPVANAGADQNLNLALGSSTVDVMIDGSGSSDSDGTIATYVWAGTPDPADAVNPVVTLGAGAHVFTLVVTDDDGAVSAADTVTISVNTPPVANAGLDRQINLPLGASTVDVTLDGSGSSDSDGTVASYTWTGTPDPDDVVSPVVSLGAGAYVFTLVVTDDDGAVSAASTVTITVNTPPVADAGADQALNLALGASTVDLTLDGGGSSDSDGTVAAYAWTGVPDPDDVVSPVVSLGAGIHVFTLVVTDDDGAASAGDTVVISVNAPPVANAGPDQDIDIPYYENPTKAEPGMVDVTLDGSFSYDTDGAVAAYAWTGPVDPDDVASPVVALGPGEHVFTLVVTDDDGAASAADEVTIRINMAPVANAGEGQNVSLPLGESAVDVTLDGSASFDVDGSVAAYSWTGAIDPDDVASPVVSLVAGTYTFTLVVTDDDGAVSTADTVTVSVNAPPVANAGPDQDIDIPYFETPSKADPGMVDVTLDGGYSYDSDGTVAAYTWTGTVDPDDVVSPVVTLGPGTHVFTLVVTDDDGAVSAADEVAIHVNVAPVAYAGEDQSVSLPLGESAVDVTLDGSASFDMDGSIAAYSWTGATDPDDVVSPTVSLGAGYHVFTLRVTDDDGAVSNFASVTIFVNTPPVADAGPDALYTITPVMDEKALNFVEVTLDGSASYDIDGSIASYTWTGTPDPADAQQPTLNLTAGVYTFTLVVTDDMGADSAADTVTITVNAPPTADAGSFRQIDLPAGVTTADVTLDGSASNDPDGTVASYTWTGTPDPDDTVNPTVTLTPGYHTFTLVVTDDRGAGSQPDMVTIFVNQSPVADAGPDQQLDLPASPPVKGPVVASMAVTLDGAASSDPDGTISAYTWTGAPDPDDVVGPVVNLGAGVHTFTLVVTDNSGATSAADTVTITINSPPVAVITGTPNPAHADTTQPPVLTYDPTVLYGLQQHPSGELVLDYLDPADGSLVGSVDVVLAGYDWMLTGGYGLAVDPTTGTMWALIEAMDSFSPVKSSGFRMVLATLDPDTGVARHVAEYGDMDLRPYDLALTDDGTLYAVAMLSGAKAPGVPTLYAVDKTTGALTEVLEFSDSDPMGFDAITGVAGSSLLAHAYRNQDEVSVLELLDPVTLDVLSIPPASPATEYDWMWAMALALESGSSTFFLAEDNDFMGELSTVAITDDFSGAETLLWDFGTVYGGLAFGYTRTAVPETVQLDGSTSFDPDAGDSITSYAWSVTSAPPGSAVTDVSDPAIVNPTLTPDVPGDYTVELVVSDGKVSSVADVYVVTYGNTPPVADAGVDVVASPLGFGPVTACLDGSASYDVDYDALTYSWAVTDALNNPVPGFFNPSETSPAPCFMFMMTSPDPGYYTVTLTVTENKPGGVSSSDTTTIKINTPPVADAGLSQNVNLPLEATTVDVTLDGSLSYDNDGTVTAYTWTESGGVIDPDDVVGPVVTLGAGDYTFYLVVTDNDGATSGTASVTVSVNNPPVAGALMPQPGMAIPPGNMGVVMLDGSLSTDSDGTIALYEWIVNDVVLDAQPTPQTVLSFPVGPSTVYLRVTDDDGAVSDLLPVPVMVMPGPPV